MTATATADTAREAGSSLPRQTMDIEETAIKKALATSAGNVAMAARLLGISPQLLHYKIKKYAISRQAFLPKQY